MEEAAAATGVRAAEVATEATTGAAGMMEGRVADTTTAVVATTGVVATEEVEEAEVADTMEVVAEAVTGDR